MGVYPEVARNLLKECSKYREGELEFNDFKGSILSAAQQITAINESEVRNKLSSCEGRLDVLGFTTDEADLFHETLPVVDDIEHTLRSYLGE